MGTFKRRFFEEGLCKKQGFPAERSRLLMQLTIYILARNSPENLSRMLDSLLPWSPEEDTEIIIGDNSDNNCVLDLVHRRAAEFNGRLRCLKHVCNLGYSANMLRSFEVAQGRYLWIVGCNDRFLPGAVARLKSILTHRDDAVLLFKVEGLKSNSWPLERVYDDFAELVKGIHIGPLQNINSCVYHVGASRQQLASAYEGSSNLVPQLTLMAALLKAGHRLYFCPISIIERLPRDRRIWDPRVAWMTCWMIYPDLHDQYLWNQARGAIFDSWSKWILGIEKEGFVLTWPLVLYTIAQFGARALPMAIKITGRIVFRKLSCPGGAVSKPA